MRSQLTAATNEATAHNIMCNINSNYFTMVSLDWDEFNNLSNDEQVDFAINNSETLNKMTFQQNGRCGVGMGHKSYYI